MARRSLLRQATALSAVIAAASLSTVAASPASADTMRTLKVALSCDTGMAYGLEASTNYSAFYAPNGSSYASGGVKYFTVSIPASASTLAIDTDYCDGEALGEVWRGYYYSITPGTSTITTNGYCSQQIYDTPYGTEIVNRYCSMYPITYS